MNGFDASNASLQPNLSHIDSPILLSGGSGMLGTAIGHALQARGIQLLRLTRKGQIGTDTLRWSPEKSEIESIYRLEGLGAAIHLSGANVAGHRWTSAFKREMWESRVHSTHVLSRALARLKRPPAVLIAASAIGFYGNRGDEILNESSSAGQGFFPELCTAWEAATQPAIDAGIRVIHLRTGVVVAQEGGALKKMLPLFRLGLGGPLGSGRQWMSWIAESDLVSAVEFLLAAQTVQGPVNIVAPNPVTNAEFTRQLAHALHRPALIPAPAFGLRLVFGQMADEALLASTRVSPDKLRLAGFPFQFNTLDQAFAALL